MKVKTKVFFAYFFAFAVMLAVFLCVTEALLPQELSEDLTSVNNIVSVDLIGGVLYVINKVSMVIDITPSGHITRVDSLFRYVFIAQDSTIVVESIQHGIVSPERVILEQYFWLPLPVAEVDTTNTESEDN